MKYFSPGLTSKTLRYLSVLKPSSKNDNLADSTKMWIYLAQKFPNVLTDVEVEDLKVELVSYYHLPDPLDLDSVRVDKWFGTLAKITEGGVPKFGLLFKLALALATVYNSSSEAERDFSKQNLITEGKSSMTQELLQCQLTVRSHHSLLRKKCGKCQNDEQDAFQRGKDG